MSRTTLFIIMAIIIVIAIVFLLIPRDSGSGRLSASLAAAGNIEYCTDTEVCPEPSIRDGQVWCIRSPECPLTEDSCQCFLYRDKKGDGQREWERHGGSMEKKSYDDTYNYACWCTKL